MTLRFHQHCDATFLPVTESMWFGIVLAFNEKTKLNFSAYEFPFRHVEHEPRSSLMQSGHRCH